MSGLTIERDNIKCVLTDGQGIGYLLIFHHLKSMMSNTYMYTYTHPPSKYTNYEILNLYKINDVKFYNPGI